MSDSDSEGEPFVIPQFDGANDFVTHRGRRQHQSTSATPQHHRSVAASTRDLVRENALKRSRGGVSHPAPPARFHQPPTVPSSQHHPVPSPLGPNQPSSLVNPDGTFDLPDFMDISSRLAAGEVPAPSIVPHNPARGKSSRREFPPPQDMQQPPPPLNITPLSGMGMSQRVPGIGEALVVPALVTTGRVNLSSPQVLMPQSYVLQHTSPAPDLDPGPDITQLGGQSHKQSRKAAATEGQRGTLALRTLARQDSEQSAYSPISEESDGEGSGRGRRGRGSGEGRAADASAAPENEDILKQAFDMTLSDLKPMDVETPEFALVPPDYSADGCPPPADDMLAPGPYLYQAQDDTTVTTDHTQGEESYLEVSNAPPTHSPPQLQPRREPPPPTTKTKKKKQKPGRERSSIT